MSDEREKMDEMIKESKLREEDPAITWARRDAWENWEPGNPCPCHGDLGMHALAHLMSGGRVDCKFGESLPATLKVTP